MKDNVLDDDFVSKNIPIAGFVEIRNYSFEHEAVFAKAILDSESIQNFLKNANMVSVYSGMSIGLGGVGLMVAPENSRRALEILDRQEIPIEVDDDMQAEAYLLNLEMEAAEEEQEELYDNRSSMSGILNVFMIALGGTIVVFVLWLLLKYFIF